MIVKVSWMRAELKRCITTNKRLNKKQVSRGSPDEAVKRRLTSHKESRPELAVFKGPTEDRFREKKGIFRLLPGSDDLSSVIPAEWEEASQ